MLIAGCGPSFTSSPSARGGETVVIWKRVTLATTGDPFTLSTKVNSSQTGSIPGADALEELVNAGLANHDSSGSLRPQLAEAVPSLSNGLWRLLPEGRMELTWTIRQAAQWHDGTPFTSDDLLFTYQVGADREVTTFRDTTLD